ncbi:DUF4192 domain-containing protein [Kitasatospora sp. NPDC052868]|uniref:DUF4192 domain-containing protein n=1 Tax=Kitasatospora sp. NPDC052868 TaxID=3364060 RepID=UPI0037C94360
MNNEHIELSLGPASGHRPVTMRGPSDMAELLPYLLGFFPDDSIVAVGLQGPELYQGGVIRLDIPDSPAQWPAAADETAALLIGLSEQRDRRPVQVLLYLCRDPEGAHGPPAVAGLRPLADGLRAAFESRGVGVKESLCVSSGRWWSFLCRREGCCDPAGNPIRRAPAPGAAAAAATFAGLAPRGSRKSIIAGLDPIGPPAADTQRSALARALGAQDGPVRSREQGTELLAQAVAEFSAGVRELDEWRAAQLIVTLQDRQVRDRAAEYVRSAELAPAQRLWRFLAQRCVPPYSSHAAAPLTLLAWTSWVAGDAATARVVLAHTLRSAPSYLLAQLLYESLNAGLSPEPLLAGVEAERRRRTAPAADGPQREAAAPARAEGEPPESGPGPTGGPDGSPGPAAARRRRRSARREAPVLLAPQAPESAGPAVGPVPAAVPEADGPAVVEPDAGPLAQARRGPGCRTTPRGPAARKARLGRVSPWAAPAVASARRGRCRSAGAATSGARRAR